MSEQILVKGLYFKDPHHNAPEWVKGKLSIKVSEFADFLKANRDPESEYVNFQMLESKKGVMYFTLDTWKPEKKDEPRESDRTDKDYDKDYSKTNDEEVAVENIPF